MSGLLPRTLLAVHRLPACHPALLWTMGSTPTYSISRKYHRNSAPYDILSQATLSPSIFNESRVYNKHLYITHLQKRHTWNPAGQNQKICKTLIGPQESVIQRKLDEKQATTSRAISLQSLTPRAIVEASPLNLQPYLRLIRFDRPIGKPLINYLQMFCFYLKGGGSTLPNFQ